MGITIAIPNWNHELLLPRSISSACQVMQELGAYGISTEILIIDDASRDGSLTLLRQLESLLFETGLRVLALAQNGGPALTRSYALYFARYRYILYLDADNELNPASIFHFYRAIQDTGAAMVYGNLIWKADSEESTSLLSHESFQTRIFSNNYIDNTGLYDRQQIIDCLGYDTSDFVKGREDWELMLHLATNGRLIVFVPLVFGFYYDLPGSLVKVAKAKADQGELIQRIFDQLGIRDDLPLNTRHSRYHPDIGYL